MAPASQSFLRPAVRNILLRYEASYRPGSVIALHKAEQEGDRWVIVLGENHSAGQRELGADVLAQFNSVGYEKPAVNCLSGVYSYVYRALDKLWMCGSADTDGVEASICLQADGPSEKTRVPLETNEASWTSVMQMGILIATQVMMRMPPLTCICGPFCCIAAATGLHPMNFIQGDRDRDMAKNISRFFSAHPDEKLFLAVMGNAHVKPVAKILMSSENFEHVEWK